MYIDYLNILILTGFMEMKYVLLLLIWFYSHMSLGNSPQSLPTIYIDILGINLTGNAQDDQKAIVNALTGA